MIKLLAIGNIGDDAELKSVNGAEFISFRVADNRKYIGDDGLQRTNTVWLSCSMDANRKAILQYLKKGTKVFIEGYPSVRASLNRMGETQSYINVYVNNVEFCSSQKEE